MIRPYTMTEMRSARVKTASMSCSTSTIVIRRFRVPRKRTILWDSSSPSPAPGSSSKSKRGLVASAIAISSWRCSPWARLAASTWARAPSPTDSSAARAGSRSTGSARAGRQNAKLDPAFAWTASATLSRAEKSRKMLVTWNERARPRRARCGVSSRVTSSSAKWIKPASDRRSPASWPMSVVLPAPLGPMIACVSPGATSRSMPSLASRPPKRLMRPRTASNASAIARLGTRDEAEQAALREQHDEDQDGPEHDLPVRGQRREQVLEEQQHDRADHGTEQGAHAAEDHHEHDLARAGPGHEVGR